MRSATIFAATMAMATSVSAQIAGFAVFAKPATDESVPAGKPYEITWAAGKYSGPAIISLIGGETQGTQVPIKDVATIPEVGANKYTWDVDCSLGKAKVYGLKIALVNQPDIWQWSNRFHIDNSAYCAQDASSASASTSATSSASAAVSASASGYPTATISASASASASASGSAYPTAPASSSSAVHTSSKPAVTATASYSAPVQTLSSSTKAATPSTTGSTTIPTAAAPKVAAGSFVLAGVAAVAALAL